ncbi:hypothetical protein ACWDA3_26005 [Nonomuraea rubra]
MSVVEPVPTDEQIRAYLDAHPDVLAAFLRRESRRDPQWLRSFLTKEQRRQGWWP